MKKTSKIGDKTLKLFYWIKTLKIWNKTLRLEAKHLKWEQHF